MCNDYRVRVAANTIRQDFSDLKIRIHFSEGVPNPEPRDDVMITDTAPIVLALEGTGEAELIQRRRSWPGPNKKPVYNFRSDGREFTSGRYLIVADGF
jgi:putative SOS response-associated peptidase YedK